MIPNPTQTYIYPLLKENHVHLEYSSSEPIIHGTSICDMSHAYSNKSHEMRIENLNNDYSHNLEDMDKIKCDGIEQSSVDSTLKGNFSNASLSHSMQNFQKIKKLIISHFLKTIILGVLFIFLLSPR